MLVSTGLAIHTDRFTPDAVPVDPLEGCTAIHRILLLLYSVTHNALSYRAVTKLTERIAPATAWTAGPLPVSRHWGSCQS